MFCRLLFLLLCLCSLTTNAQEQTGYPALYAGAPRFRALFYHNTHVESAHQDFAKQALQFFHKLSYGEGFLYDVTTDLETYADSLKNYDLVVMLNDSPHGDRQRKAFQKYMEEGGGWMGFHAAAYNDKNTRWPWFVDFLGGGVFYCNNWPPQPVLVECDTQEHAVTKNLPKEFVVPACEWYQWDPSPRKNKDVEVLVSLSQKNYPLGIKDIVRWGDLPIVWTNTRYRMIYLNIGHGDEEFIDPTQNLLITNAFRWIAFRDRKL